MASSAVRKSAAASSSSTSLRFLGVLKQPASFASPSTPSSHLEFDESDMFWPSTTTTTSELIPSTPHSAGPNSPISTSSSASSFASSDAAGPYSPSFGGSSHRGRRPFGPERSGLSAALADDVPAPVLKTRRPAVDLYLSAARAVPAAPGAAPDERLVLSGSGKLLHMSAPVNVPTWPRKKPPRGGVRGWGFDGGDDDDEDGFNGERHDGRRPVQEEYGEGGGAEGGDDGGVMVPPHIIVARSHVTTFSVFEGVGRTLKGRDLRRVRNAVLQKTGFLD